MVDGKDAGIAMATGRMGLYACAAVALFGCPSSEGPAESTSTDSSIDHVAGDDAADVTADPADVRVAEETPASDAPREADASAIHESPDASLDAEARPVDVAQALDADAAAVDASPDAQSYDGSCVAAWHLGGGQCNWTVDCPDDASFHATCYYLTAPLNCNCNNGSTVISQNTAFCTDPATFFEMANAACGWEAGLSGPPTRN